MTNPDLGNGSFAGFSTAGYVYAPYIPLLNPPTKEEIKEHTRVPIKLIKAAMKQAGYKINKDFRITKSTFTASVFVTSCLGRRRFAHYGQCQITVANGKFNVSWSYQPTPGGKDTRTVDIALADPDCFSQISDTIVRALKENYFKPMSPGIYNRYTKRVHASYYSKVTI